MSIEIISLFLISIGIFMCFLHEIYVINRQLIKQDAMIRSLKDKINVMERYVIIPEHINCRCETGVVFK